MIALTKSRSVAAALTATFLLTVVCFSSVMAQTFTCNLSDYVVKYDIISVGAGPTAADPSAYAYNIIVYGPPPYPIQISFNEKNLDGTISNRIEVMATWALSMSIGCTSYPTQIAIQRVTDASLMPTPTPPPFSTQLIPQPSTPEYTVELSQTPVAAGATQTMANDSLAIQIVNQPFGHHFDASKDSAFSLCYDVQIKQHSEDSWCSVFNPGNYQQQSDSSHTDLSVSINFSKGSQIDVRVRAVVENATVVVTPRIIMGDYADPRPWNDLQTTVWSTVKASDWSNTQTINVTNVGLTLSSIALPSPYPTLIAPTEPPAPTAPNYGAESLMQSNDGLGIKEWAVPILAAMAFTIGILTGVIIMMRQKSKIS